MKEIILTQGKVALVDDEDFEELNKYKWFALKHRKTYYAVRSDDRLYGKRKYLKMHRVIMNPLKGIQIDHIDLDGLHNFKLNLRSCTNSQNQMNREKGSNNKSGFKGVSWHKGNKKWVSQIMFNKKIIYLGYFIDKLDAYKAYQNAAIKYHKDFAHF